MFAAPEEQGWCWEQDTCLSGTGYFTNTQSPTLDECPPSLLTTESGRCSTLSRSRERGPDAKKFSSTPSAGGELGPGEGRGGGGALGKDTVGGTQVTVLLGGHDRK